MSRTPRLALATSSTGPEPAPAVLAMMAGLTGRKWRVQHFRSRAKPTNDGCVGQITGLPGRHLDAWLMRPEVCHAVFLRGCRHADLAIVEGTLDENAPPIDLRNPNRPGRLAPIADALGLPRIAVIPAQRPEAFHLPPLPEDLDAILLDGLDDPETFGCLRRIVEMLLKKPVIGAVESLPQAREALGSCEPIKVIGGLAALGESFLRFADLDAVRALAVSREMPDLPGEVPCLGVGGRRFRVAYAHDAAFGGYFPDTLETLEALGAELVEFSPLRDESLPDGADLVLIGCGTPELFADDLAENLSLIAALRSHVCRGRRIYSEGGGTAYLGRFLIVGGRRYPMAGIFPFDAELRANPTGPAPVTRTLSRPVWLGPRGTTVRGYRSGRWRLHPAPEADDCPARSGPLTASRDMYFRYNAVGSLIHLHLASLPEVVSAFAGTNRTLITHRAR
ncbi:MAG: cobyrinic acid a,c-diamide synthase [Planctomycetota bacterium]|nr:cobyrinic acid a,c-diamide synthase [Planctomycetota bacterium]